MKKVLKTLRYSIKEKSEDVRILQYAQRMYAMGLIKSPLPEEAFKVLAEIVLTTDIIDNHILIDFKKKRK